VTVIRISSLLDGHSLLLLVGIVAVMDCLLADEELGIFFVWRAFPGGGVRSKEGLGLIGRLLLVLLLAG
jgi:hypothetical protein